MMLGLYRTSRKEAFLSVLTIVIVLAATIVTLTEFGSFGTAQGQGNLTLTPEQKAAICDPNNPLSKLDFVNTTESKICGIPVTVKPPTNATSAATNTTTGTEAPSAVPST
jgi:cell division protein FtsN